MSNLFDDIEDYLEHPEDDLEDDFKRGLAAGMRAGAEAIYTAVKDGNDLDRIYHGFLSAVSKWTKRQIELEEQTGDD